MKTAFNNLCEEEKLVPTELERLLETYTFASRLPREQEIVTTLSFKPKILGKHPTASPVTSEAE